MKPALLIATAALLTACACVAAWHYRPSSTAGLRVCADPNNLPFSNNRGEGFENRLAEMIAQDLGTRVSYTWWAQRRGFLRNTLNAGDCDVVMGVPQHLDRTDTTRPYYRSTYVFVAPRRRHLALRSFDDPALRGLRLGVQMIGDDFANSPPAHALSSRGIITNVVGYSVMGDYSQPNPPARIVEAVARGDVDAAIVWGPLAGYFAALQAEPLDLTPVSPHADPDLPFTFDISMAVRRGDDRRRRLLDDFIVRRRAAIDSVLNAYHVPRAGDGPAGAGEL
jgi:quinoprotein dehydrogenase-associated probable ABC transporter substrate-binding protein